MKTSDLEDRTIEIVSKYANDPLGYVQNTYDWGVGDLEDQELMEWQAEAFDDLGKKLRAREFPIRLAVSSGHGVGKSTFVALGIDWGMSTMADTRGVTTANTENQLKTKTWPTLAQWRRYSLTNNWFAQPATALFSNSPGHDKTWRLDAIPWSEHKPEAFAGLHNKRRRILVIFDEASAIPDIIWETAEGAMTDEDTEIIWIVLGNPTRNTGRFRDCFGRHRKRWITRQIDSRSVPITNKKQIQEWLEDHGEDSDFFRVRVRGVFPTAASNQFFPGPDITAAMKREVHVDPGDPIVLGVDVARFGDDRSIIRERRGYDCRTWEKQVFQGRDTMTLTNAIAERANNIKHQMGRHPDAINVDVTGVGGGVADRLRELSFPNVNDIVFGAKSTAIIEGKRANNMRTEIHLRAQAAMHRCAIEDDPTLFEEFSAITYGYAADQVAYAIDPKDIIKSEVGCSPDDVDAFCLLYAVPLASRDLTKSVYEESGAVEAKDDWYEEWRSE